MKVQDRDSTEYVRSVTNTERSVRNGCKRLYPRLMPGRAAGHSRGRRGRLPARAGGRDRAMVNLGCSREKRWRRGHGRRRPRRRKGASKVPVAGPAWVGAPAVRTQAVTIGGSPGESGAGWCGAVLEDRAAPAVTTGDVKSSAWRGLYPTGMVGVHSRSRTFGAATTKRFGRRSRTVTLLYPIIWKRSAERWAFRSHRSCPR
jgi:hypothetical protein